MTPLPSVTQILSPFADFSGIPPAVLAAAADRGTRVHRYCAALARDLWTPQIDPDCVGYVHSFKDWYERAVEEAVLVEGELIHQGHGFKGHPDLIGRIRGDGALTLVDYKTPAGKNPMWRAQLAGYSILAEGAGYEVKRAMSVRLRPDGGRPIVDEYLLEAGDVKAFLAALTAWRFFCQESKR